MSKLGKKLITAAREAVEVARCNHVMRPVSRLETSGGMAVTTECRLCHARFTTYELPHQP